MTLKEAPDSSYMFAATVLEPAKEFWFLLLEYSIRDQGLLFAPGGLLLLGFLHDIAGKYMCGH